VLGRFQRASMRIEVAAPASVIRESLVKPAQVQRWLPLQQIQTGLPEVLTIGTSYTSWLGPIAVQHQVEIIEGHHLRLLLSQGIDGFHDWRWGEGWVQSTLEAVSLVPLNLGHTISLLSLRFHLEQAAAAVQDAS